MERSYTPRHALEDAAANDAIRNAMATEMHEIPLNQFRERYDTAISNAVRAREEQDPTMELSYIQELEELAVLNPNNFQELLDSRALNGDYDH